MDYLPDNILLHIFRNMNLEELNNIGLVNRHFRRVVQSAISEIKHLDFLEDRLLPTLNSASFRSIISLCFKKLEKIRFFTDYERGYVDVFAQFICPKLTELDIGRYISNESFGQLLRNNWNLNSLIVRNALDPDYENLTCPNDIINANLRKLTIYECNNHTLGSFIDRCPNLRTVSVQIWSRISPNLMRDFFVSCPNLQSVGVQTLLRNVQSLLSANSFWRLNLRKLAFEITLLESNIPLSDMIIQKIIASFPRLEEFSTRGLDLTNQNLASSVALTNIEKITAIGRYPSKDMDVGLCQLIQCTRLQEIRISARIQPQTLVILVNHCETLRSLTISGVLLVDENTKLASDTVKQFNGFGAKLEIRMVDVDVWKSKEVRDVLKELQELENRSISFKRPFEI